MRVACVGVDTGAGDGFLLKFVSDDSFVRGRAERSMVGDSVSARESGAGEVGLLVGRRKGLLSACIAGKSRYVVCFCERCRRKSDEVMTVLWGVSKGQSTKQKEATLIPWDGEERARLERSFGENDWRRRLKGACLRLPG